MKLTQRLFINISSKHGMIKIKILFFLIFSSFIFSKEEISHLYFTFSKDPSSTFVVHIHSLVSDPLTIKIKNEENVTIVQRSEGNYFALPHDSRYLHHLEFENLSPKTIYTVEIYRQDCLIKTAKIETLSTDLKEIKVVIGGDLEIIHQAKAILNQMKEADPSVIFFGGDYPKDVYSLHDITKWDEWLKETTQTLIKKNGCQIPWVLAIGNNEVFGSFNQTIDKAPFFHAFFPQSEENTHYFSLNFSNKLFLLILDSGLTASHDGIQKEWIKETLEKHQAIPLKMALYHVPIYPSVRFKEKNWYYKLARAISNFKEKKQIAARLLSPQSNDGFQHWAPIFDQHQVKVAFEHHDHAFKRSLPIKEGKIDPTGTTYLGDGALAPFPQFTPIQKFFDFRLKKSIGHVQFFWLMTFKQDKIDFQAISKYGKSIDHFSIEGPYE